jgi:hypothetical protein
MPTSSAALRSARSTSIYQPSRTPPSRLSDSTVERTRSWRLGRSISKNFYPMFPPDLGPPFIHLTGPDLRGQPLLNLAANNTLRRSLCSLILRGPNDIETALSLNKRRYATGRLDSKRRIDYCLRQRRSCSPGFFLVHLARRRAVSSKGIADTDADIRQYRSSSAGRPWSELGGDTEVTPDRKARVPPKLAANLQIQPQNVSPVVARDHGINSAAILEMTTRKT